MRSPRKLTAERVEVLLSGLAKGYTVESMAGIVGVARETIYKKRQRDPLFRVAMIRAMDISVARLEQVAYQAALQPDNFQERKFILINRARDRWRDRSDLIVGGDNDDGTIVHRVVIDGYGSVSPAIAGLPDAGVPRDDSE